MQYLCKRVNDCFLAPTGALYAMMCYYITELITNDDNDCGYGDYGGNVW